MSNPTPKELSDRLEAVRRSLRASGKIGTESPENYELVSILNGIAGLEGQNIEGLRAIELLKEVEPFLRWWHESRAGSHIRFDVDAFREKLGAFLSEIDGAQIA